MRALHADLTAAQQEMSATPILSMAVTGGSTYGTDRILMMNQIESHDSHKAEIVLQYSDGVMTALDLKGKKLTPAWGFTTASGDKTSATAPLWIRGQQLESSQGRRICTLSCVGIPDRLSEEKADDDYAHDWSSTKTVLDLVREVASGNAIAEDTIVANLANTPDGSIRLDNHLGLTGTGQGFPVRPDDDTFTIKQLSFKLKKTGSPSGDITFRIDDYEGSSIASKVLGNASTLTSSADGDWYTVVWDSPEEINPDNIQGGGIYMWVLFEDGDLTNYVDVFYSDGEKKPNEVLVRYDGGGPLLGFDTGKDCAYKYVVQNGSAGVPVFQYCYDASPSTGWTVTDDTDAGDSLLTTYMPKDAFFIRQGDSRLSVIDKLLSYTNTERRFEDDGEIHLKVPATSGAYDYEHALDTGHTFFAKSIREALVVPNKVVVESFPNDDPRYSGNYASPASYALMPINSYLRTKLEDTPQATAIATAMIKRVEMASQSGSASVPMNAGLELFDYINVTDERASDNRDGNIGSLQRHYDGSGTANSYMLSFSLGGFPAKGVPGFRLGIEGVSHQVLAALEYPSWFTPVNEIIGQAAHEIDALQKNKTAVWESISTRTQILWNRAALQIVENTNITSSTSYTEVDVSSQTSDTATMALVRVTLQCDSITGSGRARCYLRRNGDNPVAAATWGAAIDGDNGHVAGAQSSDFQIIGLDSGQIFEYRVAISGTIQVDLHINLLGYME